MRPTASARGPLLRRRPDHQPVARPAERGLVRVHGVEPGAPRVLLAAGEPRHVHLDLGEPGERRARDLGAHGVALVHVDHVAGLGDAARREEGEAHGLPVVVHLEPRVEAARVGGLRVHAQPAPHEPGAGHRVGDRPPRRGLGKAVLPLEVLRREEHAREPVHALERVRAVERCVGVAGRRAGRRAERGAGLGGGVVVHPREDRGRRAAAR
jgi:hypothetical protein